MNNMQSTPGRNADADYRQARRRAKARLGFIVHALVFCAFGAALLAANYLFPGTHRWTFFPLGGWAIGLFFHGLAVHGLGAVRERMIEAELRRIRGEPQAR